MNLNTTLLFHVLLKDFRRENVFISKQTHSEINADFVEEAKLLVVRSINLSSNF